MCDLFFVNISSVTYSLNFDYLDSIFNEIDHSVIAYANTPGIGIKFKFLIPMPHPKVTEV